MSTQATRPRERDHETGLAPQSRRYQSPRYRAKRILLGPALRTSQLVNERISKRVALAVFSSDPISSTAYATEEILLILVAGVAATRFTLPVSLAIAGLLLLLVVSYRQVIEAYPAAGGAYVVSRDNFGNVVASVAGAALLIDYVLTVAVSIAAGVAAITSAAPGLYPYRIWLCLLGVTLITVGNLRGVRESGKLFAAPTYLFIAGYALMIGWGTFQWLRGPHRD